MKLHPNLLQHLAELTAILDDGTDYGQLVQTYVDDVAAAVPGFLGLDLQFDIDGDLLAITTMDGEAAAVQASLAMPLRIAGSVTYYSSRPRAFRDLAADALIEHRNPEVVTVDHHLHPGPRRPGIIGLTELSTRNQQIGNLIARGRTPEQARAITRKQTHPGDNKPLSS